MTRQYQCAVCEGVFDIPEEWTDEMRIAEYEYNFPGCPPAGEGAEVCDDCYKELRKEVGLFQ